jgi:hypothetical protein
MIQLTNKETRLDLQSILKENGIKFSQLDTKEKLIQLIGDFNKGDKSIYDQTYPTMIKVAMDGSNKEITGDQYCNIKGYNSRTRFFINKKYGQETFLNEDWDQIFQKEKLI